MCESTCQVDFLSKFYYRGVDLSHVHDFFSKDPAHHKIQSEGEQFSVDLTTVNVESYKQTFPTCLLDEVDPRSHQV